MSKIAQETKLRIEKEKPVYKIVLTGGPCGGKTTASSIISSRLEALGWKVFCVPEAATIILRGGISFYKMSPTQQYMVNLSIIRLMKQLEDCFYDIAKSCGKRAVVLCDRGTMDVRAYMDPEEWQAMLDEEGWTTVNLRDTRYDCILHLVTAANGAEKFYNNGADVTRVESPEVARDLDAKIKKNWVGHPHFQIVDNKGNFEDKMSAVLRRLLNFLGEKSSGYKKRKFLVKSFPKKWPVEYHDFAVEHTYTKASDGTEVRLRKRGQFGTFSYLQTTRYPDQDGQRIQLRRLLSPREFVNLLRQSDPLRCTVKKTRRSFLYEDKCFELDTFITPHAGLMLLESYLDDRDDVLPSFMDIVKEVTGSPEYSMANLALIRNENENESSSESENERH